MEKKNLNSKNMKRAILLEKPSGTIGIGGNLNIRQRKFYNGFLHNAKDELLKNANTEQFRIPLSKLKETLDISEDDRNNNYYKKIIKELYDISIEYNVTKKDKQDYETAHLLDNAGFEINFTTGEIIVKYTIPLMVRKSILKIIKGDPDALYAIIDLVIIRGLKSKYSVILYELCKDYEKVQIPKMTIEQFKKIFGIEKKKAYNSSAGFAHIRQRILKPAIDGINNNDKIEFLVDCELIKQGNAYTHIKFSVKPKPAKLKLQQQANNIIEGEVKENPDLQELILLLPTDLRNRAKIINIVLGGLEKKGKDYTKAQIEYVVERFNKGKIKNVEMYLKKAIEKDYASAEKINLGDVVSDWKQKLIDLKKVYILGDNKEYLMKSIQKCDEEGMCNVQFVSTENSERIEWAEVSEEKLKNILEKNKT